MEPQIITTLHRNFEECVNEDNGVEFWYARELQTLLGYGRWENFENALNKVKVSCETAKQPMNDHTPVTLLLRMAIHGKMRLLLPRPTLRCRPGTKRWL